MNKEDLKIVFFGTPEFAVESLKRLLDDGYNIRAVVTMPDKIAGRGHRMLQSDVKKFAVERGLPVLQPEKLKADEFVDALREIDADLFIVIAFRMLPEVVWRMPRLGTFNLHGSLLPKYRGAAPINRAIMNGETKTGVTTFFLKHAIDTGDMIAQRETDILPEDNAGTVHDKLMMLGADMVEETVKSIVDGTLTTVPQPEGEFIAAPKIFKADCAIDWTRNAADIHNQVRGLSPYPAAYTTIVENSGRPLDAKIFETKLTGVPAGKPGEVEIRKKRLLVGTGDEMLEIVSLQPAGKKRIPADAFLLGYHPDKFVTPKPEQ